MKHYQNYPRPQLVRAPDSWKSLNGTWNFAFDDENVGEHEKWYQTFPTQHKIEVPFTYETKSSGIEDETPHTYVWYQTTLTVDAALTMKKMLHFEGSDYITKVWVNGQCVGSHTGGYSRFSFDITDLLEVGDNSIVVKITDPMDPAMIRGKQRWLDHNFGCFYIQTTGIWKTVWTEDLPENRIEGIKLTPNLDTVSVKVGIDANWAVTTKEMKAELIVRNGDVLINQLSALLNPYGTTVEVDVFSTAVSPRGFKVWTPENPNLYDLEMNLYADGVLVDSISSYFAMREIAIDGNQILLNNTPLYQRLILDQGYWKDSHLTPPSEDALVEDITKLKALGYNGVRKHQKVEDERFLYYCDVMGMLVWCEMPAGGPVYNDYFAEEFTKQWMEIVKQNYNHPCVITWTPFNESWGVPSIKHDKQQQKFTESIYNLTKSFDAMRPVIVNDGWEHTVSDIITLHDYEEKGEIFFERYEHRMDEILANKITHNKHRKAFAEGYAYRGQPILISEFGGIAYNNDDSGWGYGNKVNTEEEFIARFESIVTAIQKLSNCVGFCYTQVTDVQQEINGLMDIDRNYKVSVERVCEINKAR